MHAAGRRCPDRPAASYQPRRGIVGPWLEDRTPLKLAELIEREFGGFVPPKMFDEEEKQ
jgi:hypothetical protein